MNIGGKKIFGWVLIAFGVLFLFGSFSPDFSVWSFVAKLWPLVLILIGIYIMINRGRFSGNGTGGEKISRFIGELKSDYEGQQVGDLDVSLFVGELVLDLSGASLLPGENRLNVSVGIGEALVRVPADFRIKVSAQAFAGEINCDEHRKAGVFPKLDYADSDYESSDKKVRIRLEGFAGEFTIRREST
jgi:predicted membrane protein